MMCSRHQVGFERVLNAAVRPQRSTEHNWSVGEGGRCSGRGGFGGAGGLEHVGGAADVDRGVEEGVGEGLADVDLGGEVEDPLGPLLAVWVGDGGGCGVRGVRG